MSAELIFDRLAAGAVQGSVAVVFTWLILRAARPFMAPRLRAAAWALVFGGLVVGLVGSIPLRVLPAAAVTTAPTAVSSSAGTAVVTLSDSPAPLSWKTVAAALWLMGALALFGVALSRQWRLGRVLRSLPIASDDLQDEVRAIAARIGLRRIPRLTVDHSVQVPFVAGLFSPRIVAPICLTEPDRRPELQAALAHELAHVRRGDLFVESLAVLCRCLFFFNPLIWAASREWAAEREMACDHLVLQRAEISAKRYCQMLINFAERRAERSALLLAVTNGFRHLNRRICQMTSAGQKNRGAASLISIIALGVTLAVAAPLTLQPGRTPSPPLTPSAPEPLPPLAKGDSEIKAAAPEAPSAPLKASSVSPKPPKASPKPAENAPVPSPTSPDHEDFIMPVEAVEAMPGPLLTPPVGGTGGAGDSSAKMGTPSSPSPKKPDTQPATPVGAPPILPSTPLDKLPTVSESELQNRLDSSITITLNGATFDQTMRALFNAVRLPYRVTRPIDETFVMDMQNEPLRQVLDSLADSGKLAWSIDPSSNTIIISPR